MFSVTWLVQIVTRPGAYDASCSEAVNYVVVRDHSTICIVGKIN